MKRTTTSRRSYAMAAFAAVGTLGIATAVGSVTNAHADGPPRFEAEVQFGNLYADAQKCEADLAAHYPMKRVISHDNQNKTIAASRCLPVEGGISLRVLFE